MSWSLQLGGALGAAIEVAEAFGLQPWPELTRGNLFGPFAQTVGNVSARNDQVAAVVPAAPDQQVNVRTPRVVVLSRDPVEACSQVLLGLAHKFTGVLT